MPRARLREQPRPEGGSAGEWLADTKTETRTKPEATPHSRRRPEGCSAAQDEAWSEAEEGGVGTQEEERHKGCGAIEDSHIYKH